MRSSQRKLCEGVVVEVGGIPRCRAVTALAGLREPGLNVRRVVGFVEVVQVTTDASGWGIGVIAADVAGRTIQGCVCARERVAGELQVVEPCAHPVIHAMALGTGRWKLELRVIRLRLLKITGVAAVAVG